MRALPEVPGAELVTAGGGDAIADAELARLTRPRSGARGARAGTGSRPDRPPRRSLVAEATLLVCGDTGIAHLATAYGTPSVVLFGPVSPQHWGPLPERLRHVALWAGSTGDTFADQPDPGLLRISIAEVIAAAERLMSPEIT